MKSRKAFAFEYMGNTTRVRVLKPESAKVFDPKIHFQWFEESDYLADALKGVPYATYKTDDQEKMEDMLQNGYVDADGTVWTSFFGYWKDQKGRAYMCPESYGINDLRQVGVSTFMKSPNDFMKVGKYVNRLFSALAKSEPTIDRVSGKLEIKGIAVWGKEVSWNDKDKTAIVRVEVEGDDLSEEDKELSIRYVDLDTLDAEQKALVDGAIIISERAV